MFIFVYIETLKKMQLCRDCACSKDNKIPFYSVRNEKNSYLFYCK